MTLSRTAIADIEKALLEPFDPRMVKFKPAVVSGQRALALAYVDARVIQDRLDDVLGVTGWQDEYECLPDGSVVCRLRLRLGDEWITKMDVGGQSEQPDEGDRRKAAFSDALKRAAVKFGIGRYLYRLPQLWCDYDPKKREFTRAPTLPAWALPVPEKAQPSPAEEPAPASSQPTAGKRPPQPAAGTYSMPASGDELDRRLRDYDARLARQGVCRPGELLRHVGQAGARAGFGADLKTWSGPAIQLAIEETRAFEKLQRQEGQRPPDAHLSPDDTVGEDLVAYLRTLATARGWTVSGLEASCRQKYHLQSLVELKVREYRACVESLLRWQPRNQAKGAS